MDTTDLISKSCSLSKWSGDSSRCRRCDRVLSGRSWKWCSKRCSRIFQSEHLYRKARVEARRRARGKCDCKNVRSHVKCQKCGRCEGQLKAVGSQIEINHITARRGQSLKGYSCIHHQSGLEALCHECHVKTTRQQRVAYRDG